jgi:hypothetical protein
MLFNGQWRLQSKCLNDDELQERIRVTKYDPFFDKPEHANGKWAKEYCSDCPVRLLCLGEAMQSLDLPKVQQLQGIWGGMTYRSRVRLKKKQKEQIQQFVERMKEQFPDTPDPIAS